MSLPSPTTFGDKLAQWWKSYGMKLARRTGRFPQLAHP
jgi:hypothetical protein